ncbi:hypothetical protein C8F01DRAFT_1172934 [Mycena amicta]|nr:hypothetical protein C8F01DRAFT_1172934 [Mycena amicta]
MLASPVFMLASPVLISCDGLLLHIGGHIARPPLLRPHGDPPDRLQTEGFRASTYHTRPHTISQQDDPEPSAHHHKFIRIVVEDLCTPEEATFTRPILATGGTHFQ